MKRIFSISAMIFIFLSCKNGNNSGKAAANVGSASGIEAVVVPTLYYGGDIVTMEGAAGSTVEAVVSEGKMIVFAGQLKTAKAKYAGATEVNLEGKTMMPGFIDPHVHPSIASTILPIEIVSAMEWNTPSGKSVVVKDHDAFINRIRELDKSYTDPNLVLVAWGYFKPYHGIITRPDLNKISATRAIVIWQRSCHEIIMNDAALKYFNITEASFKKTPGYANWKDGHVWEAGLFAVAQPVLDYLGKPEKYKKGLELMTQVVHKGGITTLCEQGYPQIDLALEDKLDGDEINKATTPFRFTCVPNAMFFYPKLKSGKAILQYCDSLVKTGTDKMGYVKAIKFYVDGAIFSQLMIMSKDYDDHHKGAWMMQPREQEDVFRTFWNANWDIHIHVNGDGGLDTLLAIIDRTRTANPNSNSTIILEHYGYARSDQHQKVAKYGLLVSNNPYYYYELSGPYSRQGLGKERASKISSVGSLERLGVPISFHSDYFMAPVEPLLLAWCGINRVNSIGEVMAPEEKVSVYTGMKAITIEAARSIKMQNQIGSIKAGKYADFVILAQNPFKIDPLKIKDIQIISTVFEGNTFPIQ